MKTIIAYDIELMRPGCVLIQAGLGADRNTANAFDPMFWLTSLTENMRCYPVTEEQLAQLVKATTEYYTDRQLDRTL